MIMSIALLSTSFASCSDENDEPKDPQPEVQGMLVTYKAQIDPAMLDFLDVTVEYTDYNGQTATATLDGGEWEQSVAFSREKGELPTDLSAVVKIAKKQSPVFTGNSVHIEGKVEFQSYTIMDDETVFHNGFSSITPVGKNLTIAVDKLDAFIAGSDGIIASHKVSNIKYDENGNVAVSGSGK